LSLLWLNWFFDGTQSSLSGDSASYPRRRPRKPPVVSLLIWTAVKTDIRWLTYVLGRMNLNQYSESSAQPGLSVSKVMKLELAVPPTEEEQAAIADVLTDIDAELAALEQQLTKTRDLKTAMIQELLTGKTRLVSNGASHA
jgi:type I restriction enzyme, S subunit